LIDALHFQNTIELPANHRHYRDDFYPLDNEVILSHLHGFAAFEERGHHYELYLASRQGLITAEYVNRQVKGGVRDKNIFLCGPSPMVNSLIAQFNTLGVSDNQIIVEDFNLT
jgi:predicted ferric reductase